MNTRILLTTTAAIALISALGTSPAAAQGYWRDDRPPHVTTSPAHVTTSPPHVTTGPRHDGGERLGHQRQAYQAVAASLEHIESVARPFHEPEAERHIDRAADALRDAYDELHPFGSDRRFWASLDDAERYLALAERRVRELAAELESLRDAARYAVNAAEREARYAYPGRADRYLDDARDELADGERAEWRGDYTDARAHYAEALESAEAARALMVRVDDRYRHGGGTVVVVGHPGPSRPHGHGGDRHDDCDDHGGHPGRGHAW